MLIYDALKEDHQNLRELMRQLINFDYVNMDRHDLIEEISEELIPHSRAEEAILYNSLRSLEGGKDLVKHSYKEHMEIEGLLRFLQFQDRVDANWKKTIVKLQEVLESHMDDEETRVFSAAAKLFTREEALSMGEAFGELKPDIQKEGVLKTNLDSVASLMPPRFVRSLRNSHTAPPT